MEHLAVARERANALLHPGAARVVDEDKGRTGAQRGLHDVGHLDGVDLAGRATGHGEVLAGQVYQAPAHGGGTGDHAIGRQDIALHAKQGGVVGRKLAHLVKAARVHQLGHAFACRHAAGLALLGLFVGTTAQFVVSLAAAQFFDLVLHHSHGGSS